MASYNPNLSNGTCYYAENTITKGNFVPCGNDAIQTWPCCMAGSFCLGLGDSNSCWDAKSGNTYVAGCTDPSFVSPECQHKPPPFHEQEWVAINQACKNLNADATNTNVTNWTGCVVAPDSVELVKLPLAACTPYCSAENILYAGSSSLAAYASLPIISGSSIFWQNNYVPPTAPASGYTPGTTLPVAPTGSYNGPTSTSSPSDPGLSTGAKAGIGVGAAVGGLLLLALIVALFVMRRRRRRAEDRGYLNNMPPAAGAPLYSQPFYAPVSQHSPPPFHHHVSAEHQGDPVEAAAQVPMPYTGYKSELPADNDNIVKHAYHGSPPTLATPYGTDNGSGGGGFVWGQGQQQGQYQGQYKKGVDVPPQELHG
ncbi:hypothetical protein B0H66DRAFT_576673 [Apodospora peruviana]|uniref:Uncharacterized protein n=1 Tax=Apodospora peruviana TaxID=516989 RepID=A0AAE0M2T0_9PEZI|nr:hypothetical protein B0H66DRAFT_576673 [Apodospora peruviana]